jgi:hypothetical protein
MTNKEKFLAGQVFIYDDFEPNKFRYRENTPSGAIEMKAIYRVDEYTINYEASIIGTTRISVKTRRLHLSNFIFTSLLFSKMQFIETLKP